MPKIADELNQIATSLDRIAARLDKALENLSEEEARDTAAAAYAVQIKAEKMNDDVGDMIADRQTVALVQPAN